MGNKELIIQVCGDPIVDWMLNIKNINIDEKNPYFYNPSTDVQLSSQAGGPDLIAKLLEHIKSTIPDKTIHINPNYIPDNSNNSDARNLLLNPKDNSVTRSWTIWQQYGIEGNKPVYRISQWCQCDKGDWSHTKDNDKKNVKPDLLIIDDSGKGFRNCKDGWPNTLNHNASKPNYIIYKLSNYEIKQENNPESKQENNLLNKVKEFGKRTTILTSVEDIRTCAVKVGISLSWERIMEEIVSAVYSPKCPFLDKSKKNIAFQRVIVTIGASGAVIIEKNKKCTLIFDRKGQEGSFEKDFKGGMLGYNTCITSVLAAKWATDSDNPANINWGKSIKLGIKLARFLHITGYGLSKDNIHIEFPFEPLKAQYQNLIEDKKDLIDKRIGELGIFVDNKDRCKCNNSKVQSAWNILEDSVIDAVYDDAKKIVREGLEKGLPNIPVEIVKNWKSADRKEIEGVRSVSNAIRSYLENSKSDTPLCFAVFGSPGSGKSFAIKQIAKDMNISEKAQLTFNLSQFESPNQLPIAFHQIRDIRLKGETPLVFWDEFDTPCNGIELGWLRYFLAPMQDGTFTAQGTEHPLGRGIYVFAGGTRKSFDEFCKGDSKEEISAKKRDFISRLRAYIDVKGPNADPNTLEDKLYMIRRACLLNSFLESYAPQLKVDGNFQIDDGILNAFLYITSYRHGARSLETLIRMSTLSNKNKFELSSLPPEHLLRMHVDVKEFNELINLRDREIIRIGITGHIKLDPERMDKLKEGIKKAIKFIENNYPTKNKQGYYFTILSPLAVGSDRIVAKELLAGGNARLIGIFPTSKDEYIKDSGKSDDHREDYIGAEQRQEFRFWASQKSSECIIMDISPTLDDSYQKTGYYVVDHSNVLIAIWDGDKPQGKGGTAEIVCYAIEKEKPICHILAENYKVDKKGRKNIHIVDYGKVWHRGFTETDKDNWEEVVE